MMEAVIGIAIVLPVSASLCTVRTPLTEAGFPVVSGDRWIVSGIESDGNTINGVACPDENDVLENFTLSIRKVSHPSFFSQIVVSRVSQVYNAPKFRRARTSRSAIYRVPGPTGLEKLTLSFKESPEIIVRSSEPANEPVSDAVKDIGIASVLSAAIIMGSG